MGQSIMDHWIEAAEARRVCIRAISEQASPRFVWPMRQPGPLMTKLRAAMMCNGAGQRSASDPKARSTA